MSRKRKRKILEQAEVTIDAMAHNGNGVGRLDGKTVFVDGALPGEHVRFQYTRKRKDVAEGRIEEVLKASPQRVTPGCENFGLCGGCNFQHLDPDQQILAKQDILVDQLQRIGKIDVPELWEPLTGPHWGYRHRARLGVKHVFKKGRVLVGFREKASPYLADIHRCPVLPDVVGNRLDNLSALVESLSIHQQVPQIEVAIGDNRVALVFRVLETPSDSDLDRLQQFASETSVDVYLQPKGPDTIVPLEQFGESVALEPNLTYALPQSIELRFGPSDFVQVNPAINRKMIERALDVLALNKNDFVLDLFCGLGNFSLPMARLAGHVTGVEGDASLVQRAADNAGLNQIDNAAFYAANLMDEVSEFDWAKQNYNKILIDPPRTGAKEVLPLIKLWQPDMLLYVSCNPSTLARDAGILVQELGYRMERVGVMDMFPHTAHVESMALFVPA